MAKTIAMISHSLGDHFLVRLYKNYVIDSILIVKRFGFKELVRKRGKKFLYFIIAYYAVRDSLIYIIIPYLVTRGIF